MVKTERSFLYDSFYHFFLKNFEKDMQDYKDEKGRIETELEKQIPITTERDLKVQRTHIQRRMQRFEKEKNQILKDVTNQFIDRINPDIELEDIIREPGQIETQVNDFWIEFMEKVEE